MSRHALQLAGSNPELAEGLSEFASEDGLVLQSWDDRADALGEFRTEAAVFASSSPALPDTASNRGRRAARLIVSALLIVAGIATGFIAMRLLQQRPLPTPAGTPQPQPNISTGSLAPVITTAPSVTDSPESANLVSPSTTVQQTDSPTASAPVSASAVETGRGIEPENSYLGVQPELPPATEAAHQQLALPPPAPSETQIKATPSELPSLPIVPEAFIAVDERAEIDRVLRVYRESYDRLDVRLTATIWPTVDTRALARAFGTLAEQQVTFEHCELDVTGTRATARCDGTLRYVPRVGDSAPRVRQVSWAFDLHRVANRWEIRSVTAQ